MTARKAIRRRAPKKSAPRPAKGSTPEASGYGNTLFTLIRKRLNSPAKRRAYVPPEQIARALRKNPGVPLPPEIHDYLCDFLEGKIPAPTGRRAVIEKPLAQIKKHLIPPTYARYLAWLKRRQRPKGHKRGERLAELKGWKTIREADWWKGPPSERAARMTRRHLGLAMDWRRVRNIVSEANK